MHGCYSGMFALLLFMLFCTGAIQVGMHGCYSGRFALLLFR